MEPVPKGINLLYSPEPDLKTITVPGYEVIIKPGDKNTGKPKKLEYNEKVYKSGDRVILPSKVISHNLKFCWIISDKKELEIQVAEIKIRATRKIGEMSKELERLTPQESGAMSRETGLPSSGKTSKSEQLADAAEISYVFIYLA